MKKHLPSLPHPMKWMLLLLSLVALGASAQQTVEIYTDSLYIWGNPCPTPSLATLNVNGDADNYNSVTDSVDVTVFWGDGTSDMQTVQLWEAGVTDFFYGSFNHSYTLAGTYYQQIVATMPNNLADTVNPIDSLYITTNCVIIDGYVYEDLNSNCIRETSDDPAQWRSVTAQSSTGAYLAWGSTDSNGYYSLSVPSGLTGVEVSTYQSGWAMTTTCPSSGFHTINSSSSQSLDFGIECISNSFDRWVWTNAYVAPPGDTGWVSLSARTYSCSTPVLPDTITLVLDPLMHYIGPWSGYPAPDVVNGNVLQWYFSYSASSYSNYWHGFYGRVLISTDTTLSLNDTVCYDTYVGIPVGEIDPQTNTRTRCPVVGVSYDPNNKLANPEGVGPLGNIDTSVATITYRINFQNTGTAPAKNVYILDSITDNLDLSSLRVLEASHDMTLMQAKDRTIRFDFKNIYLPDSTSDEEGSKGHVTVQIDLIENLPVGTQIENTAYIYFDYNAPIITNTALHTIYVAPIVLDPLIIEVIPTPVTCMNTDNGKLQLNILSGVPPYSIAWSNSALTEDQSGLAAGTYTVIVTDDAMRIETESAVVGENRIYEEPTVGELDGAVMVQSWRPYTYSVDEANGSSFEWSAVGGVVLNTTNNQAEIRWNAGPEGTLFITQKDENGCIGNSSTEVQISFVGIEEAPSSSFAMYPNPTDGMVTIQLDELATKGTLQVMDAQGRIVVQEQFSGLQTEFNLAGFSNGIYTVRLSSESSTSTQRLILR